MDADVTAVVNADMAQLVDEVRADPRRVEELLLDAVGWSGRARGLETEVMHLKAQLEAGYDRIRTHAQAARIVADDLAKRADELGGDAGTSMRLLACAQRAFAQLLEQDLLRWEQPR